MEDIEGLQTWWLVGCCTGHKNLRLDLDLKILLNNNFSKDGFCSSYHTNVQYSIFMYSFSWSFHKVMIEMLRYGHDWLTDNMGIDSIL